MVSLLILAVLCAPLLLAVPAEPGLALCGIPALMLPLRTPADDSGEGGGGGPVNVADALAKLEDKTLPLSQRLSVAAAALRGIDPTQQLAGTKLKLDEASAEVARLKSELDGSRMQLAAREKDVADLEARVAELEKAHADLAAKEQDLEKRAAAKAQERMASLGFPAGKLPAPSADDSGLKDVPKTEAQLTEALVKCKTQKERSALLREYRASVHAA
ncbi:MAG TPA: hypothetical protein PK490_12235 [Prosthecobacter sp.]|nr:hypothetical protein [Prosthecobacter sp.]HRK15055.1 hypothetical protein [Prosthecobacter sp.]